MMKPFESLDEAKRVTAGNVYTAILNIQTALNTLKAVSLSPSGIQLLSITKNENITHDDEGHIVVEVGLLKSQVQMGSMYLRDHAGALEQSSDGEHWASIGGGLTYSKTVLDATPTTLTEEELRGGTLIFATNNSPITLPPLSSLSLDVPEVRIFTDDANFKLYVDASDQLRDAFNVFEVPPDGIPVESGTYLPQIHLISFQPGVWLVLSFNYFTLIHVGGIG